MKLIYSDTKQEVKIGDEARDFRGDLCIVTSIRQPHREGSTGRVGLKYALLRPSMEFYPGVINAEWVKE